ncbi:MAG TPA: type II toxin-antitoxin system HipA family toxin [Hyphomicrobiaceae bacterium]|nr:type II toxin-antitoxin system HipA family toxin [Hyphomicrobiaceae bacterium]
MSKELRVLIDGKEIGTVVQDARGKFRFTYDEDYRRKKTAIPLSLSMPLTAAQHDDKAIRPYMWGLLPDNDDTLTSWGRRFGVNPRNPFALLSAVGEDLQGAIQMVPPDKLDELQKREGVTLLTPDILAERFADLIRDPGAIQFARGGGGQFSLAGAQRKKALYLVNGKWYEPRGRTPSTHILKPPILGFAGQVENEMFCTRLAPRVGLPAPKCWTERFGDIPVVVIERYDRRRLSGRKLLPIDAPGGEVHRVHQEDCCQALQVDPREKYQRDGGPGIRAIMDLLSGSGRPSEDRDRFMRACAFNFVIKGTDAHGKNYGLLLSSAGRFRLAPLYDLISWLPYSTDPRQDRMAMSVDGYYPFDHIVPRHWKDEARKSGYDPDRATAHVRDLIARLPGESRSLIALCKKEGTHTAALTKLANLIAERCADLAKTYGAEEMGADQIQLPGI